MVGEVVMVGAVGVATEGAERALEPGTELAQGRATVARTALGIAGGQVMEPVIAQAMEQLPPPLQPRPLPLRQ